MTDELAVPNGIVTVVTEFSTYEIDKVNMMVRRTEGLNAPTPRQYPNNAWQPYEDLTYVHDRLLFIWRYEGGVAKSTMTSPVREIW